LKVYSSSTTMRPDVSILRKLPKGVERLVVVLLISLLGIVTWTQICCEISSVKRRAEVETIKSIGAAEEK
jgi:hypothetical protein